MYFKCVNYSSNTSSRSIHDLQIIPFYEHADLRGTFSEVFNNAIASSLSVNPFIQDNIVRSRFGAIRGLHLQSHPHQQNKLLYVVIGKIYDVVLDLRQDSPTYLNLETFSMDEKSGALFIPAGCAHGFQTLSEESIVSYKTDKYYNKEHQLGIIYSDVSLRIPWPVEEMILSESDRNLPNLNEYNN